MRFLSEILSAVLFGLYLMVLLGSAITAYYFLTGRGLPGWIGWAGALGTLVVLGAPYVFWPWGQKSGRSGSDREGSSCQK